MAWAGPEGRQLGEKGLAELGDKLAGDVCRALSTGLPASGHAWACCSCRKISRGNSWVPLPGRWHQWVHCLLEGMAGVADPLLELMTFQKQKAVVWWEESLVWCRCFLVGPGFASPFGRRGLSLCLQRAPCLGTPPRGQPMGRAAHVQAEEAAVCGWWGQKEPLGKSRPAWPWRGRRESGPCQESPVFPTGSHLPVPSPGNLRRNRKRREGKEGNFLGFPNQLRTD